GPALHPDSRAAAQQLGLRSFVATPLVREGDVIGVLVVTRTEVRPFSDDHVALLEMFADQAVIAIENARLFSELEQRNGELQESTRQVSETLARQTAISEVLRVIATSPTDPSGVLQAIVDTAARLCEARNISINRIVGDEIERVANSTGGPGPLK